MKYLVNLYLICSTIIFADVKSTNGKIQFDVQSDNQIEMVINSIGLGLGVNPSSNLHVNGNAIISEQVSIGGSQGSSNLNITGTLGFGYQNVSANAVLSDDSIVFADSSSDNITLTLPYAGNVTGRIYEIKKTSLLNTVWVSGGGNLIDDTSPIELATSTSNLPSLKVVSNGSQWLILNSESLSATVAAANLISWWKMDEVSGASSFTGESDNAVGGTLNNGLTFDGSSGVLNGALNLPAGAAYGTVSDDAIYDLSTFTISCWLKRNTDSGTYEVAISKFLGTGNHREWLLGITNTDRAYLQASANGSSNATATSTSTVPLATWTHLTGTFDGATLRLYLNGAEVDTAALAGLHNGTAEIAIGAANTGTNRNFVGLIDDVRIYNMALTSAEVLALYDQSQ